jgi:hypothetical protein
VRAFALTLEATFSVIGVTVKRVSASFMANRDSGIIRSVVMPGAQANDRRYFKALV